MIISRTQNTAQRDVASSPKAGVQGQQGQQMGDTGNHDEALQSEDKDRAEGGAGAVMSFLRAVGALWVRGSQGPHLWTLLVLCLNALRAWREPLISLSLAVVLGLHREVTSLPGYKGHLAWESSQLLPAGVM